eukprot:PhM_4_TR1019/c0_g1_i1/m.22884
MINTNNNTDGGAAVEDGGGSPTAPTPSKFVPSPSPHVPILPPTPQAASSMASNSVVLARCALGNLHTVSATTGQAIAGRSMMPNDKLVALHSRQEHLVDEVRRLRAELTRVIGTPKKKAVSATSETSLRDDRDGVDVVALRLKEHRRALELELAEETRCARALQSELRGHEATLNSVQKRARAVQSLEQRVHSLRCEEAALREQLLQVSPSRARHMGNNNNGGDAQTTVGGGEGEAALEALTLLSEALRTEATVRRVESDVVVERSKLEAARQKTAAAKGTSTSPSPSLSPPQSVRRSSMSTSAVPTVRRTSCDGGSPPSGGLVEMPNDVADLLEQISRLEKRALEPAERGDLTTQLHHERTVLHRSREAYDAAADTLAEESCVTRAVVRQIACMEDDIFIMREQLCNDLRATTLASNVSCAHDHVTLLDRLSTRLGEYVELVSDLQTESARVVMAASQRGVSTTAPGPFHGHADKMAMEIAQLETDEAHLRSLIKALELRQKEIRRDIASEARRSGSATQRGNTRTASPYSTRTHTPTMFDANNGAVGRGSKGSV